MVKEWWSVERLGQPPPQWVEAQYDSQYEADREAKSILNCDDSVVCVHRSKTQPTCCRPDSVFESQSE